MCVLFFLLHWTSIVVDFKFSTVNFFVLKRHIKPFSLLLNVNRMWRELKSFAGIVFFYRGVVKESVRDLSDITLHLTPHIYFPIARVKGETFRYTFHSTRMCWNGRKFNTIYRGRKIHSWEWINFAVNLISLQWLCLHLPSRQFPVILFSYLTYIFVDTWYAIDDGNG